MPGPCQGLEALLTAGQAMPDWVWLRHDGLRLPVTLTAHPLHDQNGHRVSRLFSLLPRPGSIPGATGGVPQESQYRKLLEDHPHLKAAVVRAREDMNLRHTSRGLHVKSSDESVVVETLSAPHWMGARHARLLLVPELTRMVKVDNQLLDLPRFLESLLDAWPRCCTAALWRCLCWTRPTRY